MDSELLRRHVAVYEAGHAVIGRILMGSDDELTRTAVHEGGHAVIDRVLHMVCRGVTIIPDDDCAGHSVICGPAERVLLEWHYQGRDRSIAGFYHARIIGCFAGGVAERMFFGGDSHEHADLQQIDELLGELGHANPKRLKDRLLAWTHLLCRRHARGIKAVAGALLRDRTLTDTQVRALIGVEKRPYGANAVKA
jgi:hypothetical protein